MNSLLYYERLAMLKTNSEHLSLLETDISSGEISLEAIDSIRRHPLVKTVTIIGLKQRTFDYFIEQYGQQFRAIYFWKCPRVADLSKLGKLSNIEYILFYWNQKAERLWDFSMNPRLKGLSFMDFARMHDLSDLASAPALEELSFGNEVWTKYVVASLAPLARCHTLKTLSFDLKRIDDGDIEPLTRIPRLESLSFPARQFTTEQVAWLKARLRENIDAEMVAPFIRLPSPSPMGDQDILVVGKGKPFLNSNTQSARLEEYTCDFDELVRRFRSSPDAKAPLG